MRSFSCAFRHPSSNANVVPIGDHDITITTSDMATVGDVVTVTGVLHVDRDFGAGYRYPVIVEDASVKK